MQSREQNEWQAKATARNAEIDKIIARLGLTVESVFVPFSASRNKAEKHKTLNWRVTLKRNGREVLRTDYSAGIAACPGYKATKAPATFRPSHYRNAVCAAECESGFPMESDGFAGGNYENAFKRKYKGTAIMPETRDVIYSLVLDSDVLDAGGFENWARGLGFDPDSREAESIYQQCLELALAMRAALGDAGLSELRTAFQDY